MRECCRASLTQPGRAKVAKIAMSSAPPASRAVTAAVGLQPASMRALANGPDEPNASAEPTANSRPSRNWFPDVVESTWVGLVAVAIGTPPQGMS